MKTTDLPFDAKLAAKLGRVVASKYPFVAHDIGIKLAQEVRAHEDAQKNNVYAGS